METKNHLYDHEAERQLIGAIMTYAKALAEVNQLICAEAFSLTLHKNVYNAALALQKKGEPVDIITVTNHLRHAGQCEDLTPYHVATLQGASSPNYYSAAQIVFELYARRRAWEIGQRFIARAADLTFDLYPTIEEAREALGDVFSTPATDIADMRQAMDELYENYILRNAEGGSDLTGSPTGFDDFDEKSGGLHPGNLIIIAAETAQGKTSFALSVALSAARHGHSVAIYSLEMGKAELAARISATETGVAVNRLLYAPLSQDEMNVFGRKMMKLVGLPLYFDDTSTSNLDAIIASIRVMVAKCHIKGVVIDYLQILNVNMRDANKEYQMAEAARRLKNLAKELGIWIIALSQLRRDHANHVPNLNRLRDSGQIAEAADIVILLYRPAVYNLSYPEPFRSQPVTNTAMVDIAKGRNIGLRKFLVEFIPTTTRYGNLRGLLNSAVDAEEVPDEPATRKDPF